MPKPAYQVKPFEVASASEAEWDQLFELDDAIHWEVVSDPDDPPTSRALRRRMIEDPGPFSEPYRWAVWGEGGELVGLCQASFTSPKSPEYETNKHIVGLSVRVAKAHRRQGVARSLLRRALAKAMEKQTTTVQTVTFHDTGRLVCRHWAGTLAIEAAENRLKLAEVDWDMVQQWSQEGSKRAPGVRLERFREAPEADLVAYTALYTELMNLQPLGEIESRMKTTPESRRIQEEQFRKKKLIWETLITREPDGAISGLTEIGHSPDDPHKVFQMLTGVDPAYRGRGLGKWLKAEMLLHVRANYPKVKFFGTGNADSNAPMLSINQRLGFKRHLSETVFKFKVADLCQRLGV